MIAITLYSRKEYEKEAKETFHKVYNIHVYSDYMQIIL